MDTQILLVDKSHKQLVCPITLEEIKEGGMTCFGNIYEYTEILKWVATHDTDPLTNQYLPNKFIRKVDIHKGDIQKVIKDARNSFELWCPFGKIWAGVRNIYEKILEASKTIDFASSEWITYNKMKRNRFIAESDNAASMSACTDVNEVDKDDTCKRPLGTGKHYDFIDLSLLCVSKNSGVPPPSGMVRSNCGNFKSEVFCFTNFSSNVFISCDFSRVRFIGCNLDNTQFINCTFIGEEVCFYKSYGKIKFVDCTFEYMDKWVQTKDLDEVIKILKCRLRKGSYTKNIYSTNIPAFEVNVVKDLCQ